jgi:hypothetical protein
VDEDQQFFDVLKSLKRDELVELITDNLPMDSAFISMSLDADDLDLDKLGERVGRITEIRRGGIVRKGVIMNQVSPWRRVKHEMNLLLCTKDKKYAALRKQLSKEGAYTHGAIVSAIAAAVGASLGLVSGLLVPLVALMLVAMLKVGKEAYCAGAET